MNLYDLFEDTDGLPLDYDYQDEDDLSVTAQRILTPQQQRMLDRHRQKQNRLKAREAERKRRAKEGEIYQPSDDYYEERGSKHVPKSAVGYKPFKWPMIRFGKFGDRSKVGFDAEMRQKMGNKTHEPGISCFHGKEYRGGYLILDHDGRPSWSFGFDPKRMLYPWVLQFRPQYRRWQQDGTPMDVFLLRGHLTSFGRNDEWLEVGSDGEYLVNPRQPFTADHVSPDQLWLSEHQTLRQYYDDLDQRGVRLDLDDEE